MAMTDKEIKATSELLLQTLERVLIEKIKEEFKGTYELDDEGAKTILAKIGLRLSLNNSR
jgi:hypothetical protein